MIMVAVTLCWDQLFLIYNVLPATIPPALVLIGVEIWRARRRPRPAPAGEALPSM